MSRSHLFSAGGELMTSTEDTQNKHLITGLRDLYLVIIGLSLESLGRDIFDYFSANIHITDVTSAWLNKGDYYYIFTQMISFLMTIVPFTMGAIIHFEREYLSKKVHDKNIDPRAILLEFFIIFMQGSLFVILAHQCISHVFGWMFVVVIFLDSLGSIALKFSERKIRGTASPNWFITNMICACLCVIILLTLPHIGFTNQKISIVIMMAAIIRTFIDFWSNWAFYFGQKIELTQ
jgi:hypothetical protein